MKISVCLATFNGEKYIKQQLESILSQLSDTDEVIISDDSSSDLTIQIVTNIEDPRIRILKNQVFKNPIYNFENALKYATGDYIFLSDQDDIWENNKVKCVTEILDEFHLVISDCQIVDSNGKLLHESFYELNKSSKGLFNNLISNSYLGCTMAFKKEILGLALPFPKNLPMHDWWLGLVAEVFFKTKFINRKLVQYRRHGHNASSTSGESQNSFFIKLSFRIKLIWEILKLYWRK